MNDLYLIAKIIEYDSTLLYNFLCVNSDLNKNILNNITILNLFKNTKIQDIHLKLIGCYNINRIANLKILNLINNNNITDEGLKYIPNIHTLELNSNNNITDAGFKYIPNIYILYLKDSYIIFK